MNKETKKKNNYNTEILIRIKEKYGLSKRFVTMCLSGNRTSEMAETIIKDYNKMAKAIQELLKSL